MNKTFLKDSKINENSFSCSKQDDDEECDTGREERGGEEKIKTKKKKLLQTFYC